MGEKVYQESMWIRNAAIGGGAYCYIPAGYYEISLTTDFDPDWKYVTDRELHTLIPLLERDGFIKPRLDERLRAEDLKITHRLLDLLEKK